VLALSVKHRSFAVEQEWRAVVMPRQRAPARVMKTRETPKGLVHYVELPLVTNPSDLLQLEEVWIGPVRQGARAPSIRALLQSLGYSPNIVKLSSVPLRD
jgi:hypothetical protein